MNDTVCPDDMDELITMIGNDIQDKKIKENIDMSEKNQKKHYIVHCMSRTGYKEGTKEYNHTLQHINKQKTLHKDEIRQIEMMETRRANLQKEKNEEYLPIMEAMYKAIKYLHNKINIVEH